MITAVIWKKEKEYIYIYVMYNGVEEDKTLRGTSKEITRGRGGVEKSVVGMEASVSSGIRI